MVVVVKEEEAEPAPGGSGVELCCRGGGEMLGRWGGRGERGNCEETGASSVHIHIHVHRHMIISSLPLHRAMAK
jgi:hypothetical protein